MLETPTAVPPLFHYTSTNRAAYIDGRILPAARLMTPMDRMRLRLMSKTAQLASQMSWFTTLSDVNESNKEACGLPNMMTSSDRTAVRYRVLPGEPVFPWSIVRSAWPQEVVRELEGLPGAEPETWWVSGGVVRVELASKGVKVDR